MGRIAVSVLLAGAAVAATAGWSGVATAASDQGEDQGGGFASELGSAVCGLGATADVTQAPCAAVGEEESDSGHY
jgi:hypothetical protein